MSKAISEGQARGLIASFSVDTPWEKITTDIQPFIELRPAERGKRFAAFLQNGGKIPPPRWCEKADVIYLPPMISDGTDGPGWAKRLEEKGFMLSQHARKALLFPNLKFSKGVVYNIAVIKASFFAGVQNRQTRYIFSTAKYLKLRDAGFEHGEIACLIRENFSNEEIKTMGLWGVVPMHQYEKNFNNEHVLLGITRLEEGWFDSFQYNPSGTWNSEFGFAFLL